eukprot:7584400-Pyramimonas_sp.AAC.1
MAEGTRAQAAELQGLRWMSSPTALARQRRLRHSCQQRQSTRPRAPSTAPLGAVGGGAGVPSC